MQNPSAMMKIITSLQTQVYDLQRRTAHPREPRRWGASNGLARLIENTRKEEEAQQQLQIEANLREIRRQVDSGISHTNTRQRQVRLPSPRPAPARTPTPRRSPAPRTSPDQFGIPTPQTILPKRNRMQEFCFANIETNCIYLLVPAFLKVFQVTPFVLVRKGTRVNVYSIEQEYKNGPMVIHKYPHCVALENFVDYKSCKNKRIHQLAYLQDNGTPIKIKAGRYLFVLN